MVDGEVVLLDEKGKSNFGALQDWRSEADGEIYFYVFDVLWLNGKDLMQIPLIERRTILKQNIPENDIIRFSENFEVSGECVNPATFLKNSVMLFGIILINFV